MPLQNHLGMLYRGIGQTIAATMHTMRSHYNTLPAFIAAATAIALSIVASSTASAQDEGSGAFQQEPREVQEYYTLAPDSEDSASSQSSESSSASLSSSLLCAHKGKSDDIHRSSNGRDVSVHGWWIKISGNCPPKAKVWVELQAWRCKGWWIFWRCGWDGVDRSRPELIYPGGGKANRVNARHVCVSNSMVSWRTVVDVDIPGQPDPSTKFHSRRYNLACNPRD